MEAKISLARHFLDARRHKGFPTLTFGKLVFGLDAMLRRHYGIQEFTTDCNCIFRINLIGAERELTLHDGTVLHPGDRILDLHIWNEQVPKIGSEGPTFSWARRFNCALDISLRELARFVVRDPRCAAVRAIRADMALGAAGRRDQLIRMATRFGFEPAGSAKERSLAGWLHHAGQNILMCMLVLAANPRAFRPEVLRRERAVIYLSRGVLLRRFSRDPLRRVPAPERMGQPGG